MNRAIICLVWTTALTLYVLMTITTIEGLNSVKPNIKKAVSYGQ